MGKTWRWLALGAAVGLVLGWLLVRRRRARPALPDRSSKQEEVREDRIVLPLSRAPRSRPRADDTAPTVPGQITLPDGRPVDTETASAAGDFSEVTGISAGERTESPAPEDDRIEIPLHVASGRPAIDDMNGVEATETSETLTSDTGEQVNRPGEPGTGIPDGSVDAYCVRCKTQRPMIRVTQYMTSKNRAALKGECSVCGAGMFKFVKE